MAGLHGHAHVPGEEAGCSCALHSSGVAQSMQELEFERGIWPAAMDGELSKVEKLLKSGICPSATDSSGYTALHYASRSGHLKICQLLVSSGANINAQTPGGVTPLHRAAYCGHVEIAKLLVEHGGNAGLVDSDGRTALHKLQSGGSPVSQQIIKLEKGDKSASMAEQVGEKCEDYDERAYTKWFNSILSLGDHAEEQITNLQTDLQDGLKLIRLLEILTGKKFSRINKQPKMKHDKLENLNSFFKYLKEANIKHDGIGSEDVYNGKRTLILGLIWTLIHHFHISGHDKRLLAWVNAHFSEMNIQPGNFSTDWNDGVALCALVEHIHPGACPNYATLDHENKCSHGIKLAEKELGVVQLIKPDELYDVTVEPYRVATYISSFCKPANERLLKWVKGKLPDCNITNDNLNTDDWQNGANLAYLLNAVVPELPNFQESDPEKALDEAMKIAGEKYLKEKPVFTASELASGDVDKLSLATYLTQLQRYDRSVTKLGATPRVGEDNASFKDGQQSDQTDTSTNNTDTHPHIVEDPSKSETPSAEPAIATDSDLSNYVDEHVASAGFTFTFGIERNDVKKRYRISIEEESGEPKITCTALNKEEQEFQVLRHESKPPNKTLIVDQKKSSDWNCFKVIVVVLLLILVICVMAILSLKITDPEVRPI